MQTADSTHGPTSERVGSPQPDLIVFIVLNNILIFLKCVILFLLFLLITLWFYVMFL